MAHLLGGETLHLEYPTGVVFDSVTVGVSEGDRIGIVGRNGDGKSTLLGMLTGRITPHAGRVTRRSGLRVGSLDQTDTLDPGHTVSWSLVGDRPEHEWAGDARIRDVIGGLVADIPFDAPVSTLSGGQRRRIQLAALLIGDWDVIALDEPTNHLDIQGITWLAGHIKQRWARNAGGLLLITHDRWFLDEVATTTWEVHDRIVEPFEGGYAAYVLQRVERDRQAASIEAKRQNLMRKELAWLRRGAPARTSKPKFRIDAANALISDVPPLRNTVELSRLATARLGKDVIDLLDVSVVYPGSQREVLRDIEWRIGPGERTGIVGANGAGKSTLLGLIAGTVTPTSGRVKRGKTVRLSILDQQSSELDAVAGDMVREVIGRLQTSYQIDGKDLTPAQLLERLGFARDQLSTRVGELSGGQRRRLQLMLVVLSEPNVLVLDEPTNDVDTDMLTATEDLLDSWPGTLIVVSHDRYLLERVTDQQYAILDGRLRHLPGGVDEYLRLTEQRAGSTGSTAPAVRTETAPAQAKSGAELRAVEKEISSIDRSLAKLADRISGKHDELAAHDQSDHVGLGKLTAELRELESQVADLEARWMELSELLE
ncbi:ABC-F family ATP-binding cassette domain-containing protein [Mycolicibacterium fortuitum]|uniref:ABC-F family ATP-binding cassette domain-containing protein n=2 Tax=Mycolicibacterium fortuitum TaxID=1766 RepID=A0AAE4VJL1_MYCFO|nr:ABC-F family ATP-binding cassette domain-containing protein [Mycolicibacterium fortuitum]MCA4754985.1 ABC-F family ATP-binding cassette domain-containing protein [Mycolicibacterium fortuitum]MCV7140028.1 ABC-F family ATP-binding cassette domain-containing protein [Mycolicibacterium fortuitum]MDV7194847.1 ABC-F family ATP-binding cassette domain-containing protein [Mycolicibacterium fortuitum]MDV7208504.1 ABC-F family ATP-binding cassette domain-containing protein [Mycolicibacterium fortuitum